MLRRFRRFLIVLILAWTCGLITGWAAPIPVLEIPDRVIVPGPQVYLSDLGSLREPTAAEGLNLKVDLGPAPHPGHVRVLSRDYLGLILKQKGFNANIEIRMGKQVEIRVESTCITGDQVAAAIHQALPSDNRLSERWLELRNLPAETWLSKGEWQINVSPLGEIPRVGTILFRVTFAKGNELKTINVSGKIRARGWVYQAVRDLKRHSQLNEGDFRLVEIELASGREFLGRLPQDIRSTNLIREGTILETDYFQPLPLVTKQNFVNVMVKGGNVAIKMTGIAAKDGWLGDQILIINPDSKKKFQGRVIGQNLVEVNL